MINHSQLCDAKNILEQLHADAGHGIVVKRNVGDGHQPVQRRPIHPGDLVVLQESANEIS